jgi:SAM-dependent methyltransferase
MKTADDIHKAVEQRYSSMATNDASCCGDGACGGSDTLIQIGYRPEELADLPDEALMGLGCGSPVDMAGISEGEKVLDLGSGGGIDVFLAARRVGSSGRVIGVDMSEPMLERARANAARIDAGNVEFRHGLIEDMPVADAEVDVVLSNCVINLAADKPAVFREAFRVLAPGGRLVVSDLVAVAPIPAKVASDPEGWASCVGGTLPEAEYLAGITAAGFDELEVLSRSDSADGAWVESITVRAVKA